MTIPTTKQTADQNLANFESELGQQAPQNPKSFLRVMSQVLAIMFTSLYKFGVDRIKQVLWTTAGEEGMTTLGNEYGVTRKEAVATVLTVTLPGTNGTIIPATNDFVGDSNGVRYSIDASATITGGIATLSITAKEVGTTGNLNDTETLTLGTPEPGADNTATVTETTTIGANKESLDSWRLRGLDKTRAPGGGGNAADYRNWAQEVAGVQRAYPYAGKPAALLATSSPPDRTVYVEATTAIQSDGIAPQSMLDDVRDSITTDPDTGLSRQPLGLTDDTLFVESIIRTSFFVKITGLTVDASIEATVKDSIETQLTNYFRGITPFIDGVDAPIDRDDLITDPTVSNVVQDVLSANGGSAQSVAFDITLGGSIPEFQLGQGEMAKLSDADGVTYV